MDSGNFRPSSFTTLFLVTGKRITVLVKLKLSLQTGDISLQCFCMFDGLTAVTKKITVLVKALCYKPEGRGFEIRRGECISFLIYLIVLAALGPGVYSASIRNEFQKQRNKCFWGVKRCQCVGRTTLPPSVS
jgi:hypothetical protein